jgi:hypothetical protein
MVVWKMPTFLMSRRLTVEHSYSKKMLESGDNQIKKKPPYYGTLGYPILIVATFENHSMNWMPSNEAKFDGAAEDIQESTEAAFAATSQGS